MLRLNAMLVAAALSLVCLGVLSAQYADLPPGPMEAKVRTACLECHDARIIVQQRLSKAAWTREVDKMIKWGSVVDPADRGAFIDYLSTNFPADKAPYVAPRTVAATKKQGRETGRPACKNLPR
jgi:hypothetical protein